MLFLYENKITMLDIWLLHICNNTNSFLFVDSCFFSRIWKDLKRMEDNSLNKNMFNFDVRYFATLDGLEIVDIFCMRIVFVSVRLFSFLFCLFSSLLLFVWFFRRQVGVINSITSTILLEKHMSGFFFTNVCFQFTTFI